MKKKLIFVCLILAICILSLGYYLFYANAHESLPYQLIFVNTFEKDIELMTGKIDLERNWLQIEYVPFSTNQVVYIHIAEVIGRFSEMKLLGYVDVQTSEIGIVRSVNYFDEKIRKGGFYVLWVEEDKASTIDINKQSTLLFKAEAILAEQYRLIDYLWDSTEKDLIIEIGRNIEE